MFYALKYSPSDSGGAQNLIFRLQLAISIPRYPFLLLDVKKLEAVAAI
jgi:hypothetical protein